MVGHINHSIVMILNLKMEVEEVVKVNHIYRIMINHEIKGEEHATLM